MFANVQPIHTGMDLLAVNLFIIFLNFLLIPISIQTNLEKLKTYGETCNDWTVPCDYSLELMCSTGGGTGCSCPNTYSGGYCDCPTTKYWNGTKCCNIPLFIFLEPH